MAVDGISQESTCHQLSGDTGCLVTSRHGQSDALAMKSILLQRASMPLSHVGSVALYH